MVKAVGTVSDSDDRLVPWREMLHDALEGDLVEKVVGSMPGVVRPERGAPGVQGLGRGSTDIRADEARFLTVPEAADQLRCAPKTVRGYINGGVMRAKLIGGQYLIAPADLEHFIESRATAYGAAPPAIIGASGRRRDGAARAQGPGTVARLEAIEQQMGRA